MSYTVRCYNKNVDATYVYRCENYKDPDTGKWKSRRECVGKLDENGHIVPTGKRGRKRKESVAGGISSRTDSADLKQLENSLRSEIQEQIQAEYLEQMLLLQNRIAELEKRLGQNNTAFSSIIREMTHITETAREAARSTQT